MKKTLGLLSFLFVAMTALPLHAQQEAAPKPATEAPAAQKIADMTIVDTGTVKEILKSDLIMLDNNKRYRLDDILIPPHEDGPVVEELKQVLLNKPVTVYTYRDPSHLMDRYGLPLVHVVTGDNLWVQQDLVAHGLVWAYSAEITSPMAEALKQIEEKARAQRHGFWRDPVYSIKTPENAGKHINTYQIVEGRIITTSNSSETLFFNFTDDWKTGFTVRAKQPVWYAPGIERSNPQKWRHRRARVRGWIIENKKPIIEITNRQQIDLLPDTEEEAPAPELPMPAAPPLPVQ